MASLSEISPLSFTDTVIALDGKGGSGPSLVDIIYASHWVPQGQLSSVRESSTYVHHTTTFWTCDPSGVRDEPNQVSLRFMGGMRRDRMPTRPTLCLTVPEPIVRGGIEHRFFLHEKPRAQGTLVLDPDLRIPLYGRPYPFDLPGNHFYEWNHFFRYFSGTGARTSTKMLTRRDMSQVFCALMIMIAWASNEDRSAKLPTREEAGFRIAFLTANSANAGDYGD